MGRLRTLMQEETITIPKKEYEKLKSKSRIDDELLLKLVCGLEDIRAGRVKPWGKSTLEHFLHSNSAMNLTNFSSLIFL